MILVTGGTGLVGSHLLLELISSGKSVRAIHRKNSNLLSVKQVFSYYLPKEEADHSFNQIEWIEADLLDIPALTNAFQEITTVYHCAALVTFNSSKAKALRKVNIEGTANIANLCIANKIEKLCYISSIATLGSNPGEKFVTEDYSWQPEKDHTDYAISKHGAEIEIWRASQEGVPVIILNPGVIIGPGFWNKGSGTLISKVAKGLKFKFPKITGFVGVNDVVLAAVGVMNSSITNEQFIVVAENLKFDKVLEMTAEGLSKAKPAINLKPWMIYAGWILQSLGNLFFGMDKNLNSGDHKNLFEDTFYSSSKLKSKLNFKFIPIQQVITETTAIYKEEFSRNL